MSHSPFWYDDCELTYHMEFLAEQTSLKSIYSAFYPICEKITPSGVFMIRRVYQKTENTKLLSDP